MIMINKIDNPILACNLKFTSDDKGEFEGYASVFNGVDAMRDTILPGAFTETLKNDRPPSMFINHDSWEIPVGDWISLAEDEIGLFVKGIIDFNHKDGPSLFSALKRKAIDALSIGFRIPAGGAEEKEDGSRIISRIDLKEISPVNFPADDAARISVVKTDIGLIKNLKEAERFLRDAGHSKSFSNDLVSRIKDLARRDAEQFNDEIAKLSVEHNTDRLLNIIENIKV